MPLERYHAKRDFRRTPEPRGEDMAAGDRFVIQKHAARRLHYDLRLEHGGVLKSWAVTNGPSLVPGRKRLAVETEDHPLDYATFEGSIPKGEYGGGHVIIWDRGRWEPDGDAAKGLAKGHLRFALHGEKLSGQFDLVRLKPKPNDRTANWLLIKVKDDAARGADEPDILTEQPQSVVSGRTVEDLPTASDQVLRPRSAKPTAQEPKRPAKRRLPPPVPARGTAPLPAFVEPALATLTERAPAGPGWVHEVKFDGYRVQIRVDRSRVTLLTRSGLDWTGKMTSVAEAAATLPASRALIDGELVVETADGRHSFSDLQADLKAGRTERFVYFAFDLLHLDGEDLRAKSLLDRKATLATLLDGAPSRLRYSEHFETDGEVMRSHACRLGLEGIVSKRRDRPYSSGRTGEWLKSKCANRQEFVVVGYVPSTTSRAAVGSLALALPEAGGYRYVGKVGSGFTVKSALAIKAELESLAAAKPTATFGPDADVRAVKWVKPHLVAEVEFRAWTGSGHLRHASFRGLRHDKSPDEVTSEMPKATQTPKKAPAASRTRTKAETAAPVRLTHPDRIFWDDAGITKQGLADYYSAIWPHIAPHVADRPLAFVRCPDGAAGSCFFQKHAWSGLDAKLVTTHDVGEDKVLAVHRPEGLMALAQAAVLEIHPWGSTLAAPECPERLIFDLDPGDGVDFAMLESAALELRTHLADLGFTPFVKTSGGKGLHVVVPVEPTTPWDDAKGFCKSVADDLARAARSKYTSKLSKSTRKGRIFIDYLRNGRGATAVAAFSPRARPGAPVSTPLSWDELGTGLTPSHFTVGTIFRRLDALKRDPWRDFDAHRRLIP